MDGNISASSVDIKYSNYVTTSYVYNPNEKVYYRSVNDKAHNQEDYLHFYRIFQIYIFGLLYQKSF